MKFKHYAEIKEFSLKGIEAASENNEKLNLFHDSIYENVISVALHEMELLHGIPPSPFSFFVMGSAGRMEQSIWSDQDHGLVFELNTTEAHNYFLDLGKKITNGLELVGYKKCSGSVMASNPLWCKSLMDWERQLEFWVNDSSWESIRRLLIFADARSLYGNPKLLSWLKEKPYTSDLTEKLLLRMLHNTMHLKKGVGIIGQLLVETHGTFSGSLNLKDTAFFPYVNSVRLLAFYEKIKETSTLSRINLLSDSVIPTEEKIIYADNFSTLLNYRLVHGNHQNYDTGHFINVEALTKKDRKILKDILKAGEHLNDKVRRIIERR